MNVRIDRLKRPTEIGCALFLAVAAARYLWIAVFNTRGSTAAVVMMIITGSIAFGLMKQQRWAVRACTALLVLIAVILPVGLFSPFRAGDMMAAGIEPPSVLQTLAWLVPVEVIMLAIMYVLDLKIKPAEQ